MSEWNWSGVIKVQWSSLRKEEHCLYYIEYKVSKQNQLDSFYMRAWEVKKQNSCSMEKK